MTAYELMIKTNHHLIRGGELTDAQKVDIARRLCAGRITDGQKRTFADPNWYPDFYIPPHNDGKCFCFSKSTGGKSTLNKSVGFQSSPVLNMW